MNYKRLFLLFAGIFLTFYACQTLPQLPTYENTTNWKTKLIPPSEQAETGDPQAGLDFAIYGNYIGSGIPLDFMKKRLEKSTDTVLNRTGRSENLPYQYNIFDAQNGVAVTAGNCFVCHAGEINGKRIIGLGNTFSDFTGSFNTMVKLSRTAVRTKYGKNSPEYEAFMPYGNLVVDVTPYIVTPNAGVNPAFRIEEACLKQRNPIDLTYQEEERYKMMDYTLASDVPPLWNVKKKNALYYNGMGRGDFRKLLFQASFLGITDSTAAREVLQNFDDLLAWLNSLEPPKYPEPIDQPLASEGKAIFEAECSTCHGTYGEDGFYPNKLVSVQKVKTDPLYAQYIKNSPLIEWYNESWFALSQPFSKFEPDDAYIAPPLDGVWATAPYLHNGSVPTLEDLLNSKQRPTYWKRTEDSRNYDFRKVGWIYTVENKGGKGFTFDTTLPGYSNEGHYFGDDLNKKQRTALIEYLKTL